MKGARKKGKRTSSSFVTFVLLLRCASLVKAIGRTRKLKPPPGYNGVGEGGVFDMLQYFETILPLVESL